MDDITRRTFIGATAAAGAALAGQLAARPFIAPKADGWPELPPARIHQAYIGRTGGIYLSRPEAEIGKFQKQLAEIERKLGDVKFVGGEVIPPAALSGVIAKAGKADGLLLFHLSGHGGDAPVKAMGQLVELGLPTAVFTQPYSGHGWLYFPRWRQEGHKVVLLPTSDWSEIEDVVRVMRVPPRLKQTRILVVHGPLGTAAACDAKQVRERLGIEMVPISIEETVKAHEAVDPALAEAEAEKYWLGPAKRIVEPTRQEIINSARFYLALKGLMIRSGAQAVTSSGCMGRPSKACLAFSKLNDMGLVGACEGDMDSTLTMIMFSHAFGIPGFISDPVFDTSKNALIHFHCTSATKMAGPDSQRLPFTIRTQSDSERGVSLDVEMPIGQVVTCAKFVNLDTMLYSTGKIIEVTHDELGCRTQFITEIADARRMFMNWGAGVVEGGTMALLHRAVFFGDHAKSLEHLGTLTGFRCVEEGGPA